MKDCATCEELEAVKNADGRIDDGAFDIHHVDSENDARVDAGRVV